MQIHIRLPILQYCSIQYNKEFSYNAICIFQAPILLFVYSHIRHFFQSRSLMDNLSFALQEMTPRTSAEMRLGLQVKPTFCFQVLTNIRICRETLTKYPDVTHNETAFRGSQNTWRRYYEHFRENFISVNAKNIQHFI